MHVCDKYLALIREYLTDQSYCDSEEQIKILIVSYANLLKKFT
jgi:hypothetical protein